MTHPTVDVIIHLPYELTLDPFLLRVPAWYIDTYSVQLYLLIYSPAKEVENAGRV